METVFFDVSPNILEPDDISFVDALTSSGYRLGSDASFSVEPVTLTPPTVT